MAHIIFATDETMRRITGLCRAAGGAHLSGTDEAAGAVRPGHLVAGRERRRPVAARVVDVVVD